MVMVSMRARMDFRTKSSIPKNPTLSLSLLHARWARTAYKPPEVYYHGSLQPYFDAVLLWRPSRPSRRLVDVIDQIREMKRLARTEGAPIRQASKEVSLIAKIFCEKWIRHSGLRVQLRCTATKQNPHVRLFWTIAIAVLALSGDRIVYYEADDKGVTVHDVRGVKHFSSWAKIAAFYRQLQNLPSLRQVEKQPRSSEEAPEVGTMKREGPSYADELDKIQPRSIQHGGGFRQGTETDIADDWSELGDLDLPPELECRPKERMLHKMMVNGLA
jgi:hypothetical protein